MAALPAAVLPGTLIAAHALSRAVLVPMTLALPYARTDNRAAQRMAARPDARARMSPLCWRWRRCCCCRWLHGPAA